MTNKEKVIRILELTENGINLSLSQFQMLEFISKNAKTLDLKQQQDFDELYQKVLNNDYKEFFHGIENVTQNSEGYVYWKGVPIDEFYHINKNKEKKSAQDLARRCNQIESKGKKVSALTYLLASFQSDD